MGMLCKKLTNDIVTLKSKSFAGSVTEFHIQSKKWHYDPVI